MEKNLNLESVEIFMMHSLIKTELKILSDLQLSFLLRKDFNTVESIQSNIERYENLLFKLIYNVNDDKI